ncbi:hypothetical protein GH733_002725 [Mirounga leonina]|nr:hypothetical protein GH733_002725 [Mirounga leonina]
MRSKFHESKLGSIRKPDTMTSCRRNAVFIIVRILAGSTGFKIVSEMALGRCSRENCKYLHPPPHLKTQLEINGRNNLIQQKNMAMLAQQMQLANAMMPGAPLQPVPISPGTKCTAHKDLNDVAVCREYQRGNCNRGENDCRFAHPADSTMIDTNDNTVTVCMDYIKGRCSREKCKYFHPPAHLQAKIKAAQYQVNQAAAAQAAATAAAMGIPQAVLPPLPKRPALEKTNGATAVFNTGIFQYQQALANMQLQQHTAFLPPVPMVHGATPATVSAATTSATSVPFAATATANQGCNPSCSRGHTNPKHCYPDAEERVRRVKAAGREPRGVKEHRVGPKCGERGSHMGS